jgi:hypothetical protein
MEREALLTGRPLDELLGNSAQLFTGHPVTCRASARQASR